VKLQYPKENYATNTARNISGGVVKSLKTAENGK